MTERRGRAPGAEERHPATPDGWRPGAESFFVSTGLRALVSYHLAMPWFRAFSGIGVLRLDERRELILAIASSNGSLSEQILSAKNRELANAMPSGARESPIVAGDSWQRQLGSLPISPVRQPLLHH